MRTPSLPTNTMMLVGKLSPSSASTKGCFGNWRSAASCSVVRVMVCTDITVFLRVLYSSLKDNQFKQKIKIKKACP